MIKLSDFDHLRNDPRIKFKTELVDDQEFTIISYMIADPKLWQLPLALECRGITFNAAGECVSRPFHKFFNIGEREDTQLNKLHLFNCTVLEKRDGSMLVPVLINDKLFWKSKKSFYSDVAISAQKTAPSAVQELAEGLLRDGLTPIFEFTHPEHQIVINYGDKPKFTLIAIRNIKTGEYLSAETQEILCAAHGVDCIRRFQNSNVSHMIKELDRVVDFEGYVIRHPNGLWTKAKSNWYLINHRIMTELRERDIALAVADECVDDIKSAVVAQGLSVEPILDIEQRVIGQLEAIICASESLLRSIKAEPTQKDAALKYKNVNVFPLAMILYKDKEPNYVDFWKKHHLKVDYSLRVVYNQTFNGDIE